MSQQKTSLGRSIAVLLALTLTTPGVADEPIELLAGGDTMLGSWVESVIAETTYTYPFVKLKPLIDSADIFFTNLEAPFGNGGAPFEKQYSFRVKPHMVNVLVAGGINLVSLANNHIMDYGTECLRETMNVLARNNIAYAGAGENLLESRNPAILEVKGEKIGFLAYSLTFPEEFWATDSTAGTCFPWDTFVFEDVIRLSAEVDLVVVSCHWGQELMETPKPYQISLAHKLIDSGADIILGHHPHVIQGIELYKGKLIAYSLGNFIFGSYSEKARDSMLLRTKVAGDRIIDVQILPINVYNREVEFQPAPLTGERRHRFLDLLDTMSKELNADSLGITAEGVIQFSTN